MTAFADLEIMLFQPKQAETYSVMERFVRQDDDADAAPVQGLLSLDWGLLRAYQDTEQYGAYLTRQLFSDPNILKEFENACALSENRQDQLRIRLQIDHSATKLHDVRWETLCDPRNGSWLLSNENIVFSRFLAGQDRRQIKLRAKGQLRALVAISNPQALANDEKPFLFHDQRLAPIEVDHELDRAKFGLGKEIQVKQLASNHDREEYVTLNSIVTALRDDYDILYLVCHGAFSAKSGKPILYLEKSNGELAITAAEELVDQIRDMITRPRLVVLLSCQSAGGGDIDVHSIDNGALAALGPRLAEIGIPAVIAMQGNVFMKTAANFMPVFFSELSKHGYIDRAMAAARGTVRDRSDSWMPVLFTRLRQGRIWYVPGFAGEEFNLWPDILNSVKRKRCTPIIGPGLAEPILGSTSEVAQAWSGRHELPIGEYARGQLHQIAQYLAVTQSPAYLQEQYFQQLKQQLLRYHADRLEQQEKKAEVKDLISKIGGQLRAENPSESYSILARLELPIYIITNADDLLADALREAGKDPINDYSRWNDRLDLPDRDHRPTVDQPLVYHLFGCFAEPDSLILSEDDYFDYLMWVNSSTGGIPTSVAKAWGDNALLFLGFRLSDWEFRVLFRSILNQERRYRDRRRKSIAVQVDPEPDTKVSHSVRFYVERYFADAKIDVYWGSSEDLVKEMKDRIAALDD